MPHQTGDIIIWENTFGHVGMIHTGGSDAQTQVAHAQGSHGFHREANRTETNGNISYVIDGQYTLHRPPWDRLPAQMAPRKQAELQQFADAMLSPDHHAQYSKWRAVRLLLGDSSFGPGARARLAKYRERFLGGFEAGKFVSNVTCVEAVVLCYQLTFTERQQPFFVLLDAAHTMPRTLRQWLVDNWGPAIASTIR